jgi:hypothetical protein
MLMKQQFQKQWMEELKYFRIILILILLTQYSCEFFNTREAESPNKSESQYLPQTSADYVISNFVKSISERNTEYYTNCFIEPTQFAGNSYFFYPSNEAKILYPTGFDNWSNAQEKQFMLVLNSKYNKLNKLKFLITNSKSDFYSDSSIFLYDYYMELDTSFTFAPNIYSGVMQLVIIKNTNGQWGISKWYDFKKKNDTVPNTISILKLKLSN